jgi:hypothetical protein
VFELRNKERDLDGFVESDEEVEQPATVLKSFE